MTEILLKYGFPGVALIGLAAYIIRIEGRHAKERKEWMEQQEKQFDRLNEIADESNRVTRDNTNILTGLKTLLENRK